jgi:hypothetical protein
MEKGENPLVFKDSNDMPRILALLFVNPPGLPYPIKKVMTQTALANRKFYEKEIKELFVITGQELSHIHLIKLSHGIHQT